MELDTKVPEGAEEEEREGASSLKRDGDGEDHESVNEKLEEEDAGGVYYGERLCEGTRRSARTGRDEPCTNKAYYAQPVASSASPASSSSRSSSRSSSASSSRLTKLKKSLGLQRPVKKPRTATTTSPSSSAKTAKKRNEEVEEEEEEEEEDGDSDGDGADGAMKGKKRMRQQASSGKGNGRGAEMEVETEEKKKKEVGKVKYLCGVHAKNKTARRELPKRDPRERKRLAQHQIERERELVEQHRQKNAKEGRQGDVVLERLRMMRAPEAREGYLRVYPNFKHQNKADGYGCMRLSPMSLGPVEHGQPGLPPALNIENFHQGTKALLHHNKVIFNELNAFHLTNYLTRVVWMIRHQVFREEADSKGNPSKLYEENRLKFYKDPVPHRHKYKGKDKSGNKNIPLYFLWVDRDRKEHRLTYIQSRQFYCNFYERLASLEPDFAHLLKLMKEGTNLQICGYDAQPLRTNQTIEQAYLDPSTPFGHERVLYTMLLYHDQPEKYPWRVHKTFDF